MVNGTVRRLLARNISTGQIVGYALAALTGISLIFASFCFESDIRPLFAPGTSLLGEEIMIVNKEVPFAAALDPNLTTFKPAEIEDICRQPFVRSLSRFTAGRFRVKAYMDASGQTPYFATDLFFESVPDKTLDVLPAEWRWDTTQTIPVIIPRDYLNLYNFGFAGSQSLPQISEDILKRVTFRITLIGNGLRENFSGRIVGFSEQLNTILVPEAFMEWANARFGDDTRPDKTSRLIIELKNPADPQIAEFFAAHKDFKISGNKDDQGKLSYLLTLLIVIVMAVGCLILAPAIGLMMVSINLLIYKNRETLTNLVMLGYSRRRLAQPYCLLAVVLNVVIAVIAVLIAAFARHFYLTPLKTIGIAATTSLGHTTLFALAFTTLVTALDVIWIMKKMQGVGI